MPTSTQVFQVTVLENNQHPSTLASAEPQIHGRPRVFETTVPAPSGPSGPEREGQLEADAGAPVAAIVAEQEMTTPSTHRGNGPISNSHETVGDNVGSSNRRMERSPGYVRRKAPDELGDLLRKFEKINRRPTDQEAESLATQNREASNENIGPSSNRIPIQATNSLDSTLHSYDEVNHPPPTSQNAESSATQSGIISNEEMMPSSPRRNSFGVGHMFGNQTRGGGYVSIDIEASSNRIPVQATNLLDSALHSYDEVNHPPPTSQNAESSTTQNGIASNGNNMPSSHRNPRRIRFGGEPILGNQTRESAPVLIDTILHSFDDANHPTASTQYTETPNENIIENRDPLLAAPHSMRRHNSSFLSVLDTMMHMFQLEGNSEQEIETFFDNQGFSFHLLFIQGVVDVRMPPGTERELVENRIEIRLRVFQLFLELNRNGRTTEEIKDLCFHTGGCILDLVGIGRMEDDPEAASVHLYRTDMEFVEDLIFLSNTHPE
ncbi:hypothetical protein MMC29_004971 [Sticta canariensis]|nr:hypothetical protein [Sticta canariensis]